MVVSTWGELIKNATGRHHEKAKVNLWHREKYLFVLLYQLRFPVERTLLCRRYLTEYTKNLSSIIDLTLKIYP